MKFLKDVSRLVAKENLPVTWTTPKPLNLAELNMNNPEDKARYMEYRKEKFKNY